jgi:hypothetical protein
MQSLGEGIKFVFNNKTVLGAITLDMVAVLFLVVQLPYYLFLQDIKSGTKDLVFSEQHLQLGVYYHAYYGLCAAK